MYADYYECRESWLLDYPKGGGQSFHKHPGFLFSAVFFLEGHENDTALNFENPVIIEPQKMGNKICSNDVLKLRNKTCFIDKIEAVKKDSEEKPTNSEIYKQILSKLFNPLKLFLLNFFLFNSKGSNRSNWNVIHFK